MISEGLKTEGSINTWNTQCYPYVYLILEIHQDILTTIQVYLATQFKIRDR